ncbi:MAG: DMT family transporter [Planctomycetota bacterium]
MSEGEPESATSGLGAGGVTIATIAAMVAFAANSVLCRLALIAPADGDPAIGPLAFAAVRIGGGALVLAPALLAPRSGEREPASVSWLAVLALFTYAAGFSLSYVTLEAGVGALLLFGLVQITMVGTGVLRGERMTAPRAVGMAAAALGVILLVAPTGDALASSPPDPVGALLMAIAGVAWGVYSLKGRGAARPVRMTALNFAMCVPLAALALAFADRTWTTRGVALALTSGAITSGLGYAVWYTALRGHTRTSAAIVQLTVPVIAAVGGVIWLGEAITPRLVAASALVLGGVAVALVRGGR